MKNTINNSSKQESVEMLPEYDFKGKKGLRGKYYKAYQKEHTVKIYQEDGTVSVQYFTLEEGAVMLEPDVREYFQTSESVNRALRTLISLIPKKSTNRPMKENHRIDHYQNQYSLFLTYLLLFLSSTVKYHLSAS